MEVLAKQQSWLGHIPALLGMKWKAGGVGRSTGDPGTQAPSTLDQEGQEQQIQRN